MKKSLQIALMSLFVAGASIQAQAQRYVTEIFPAAARTNSVIYGQNITVIGALSGGGPAMDTLKMDVYTPSGAVDPLTERP